LGKCESIASISLISVEFIIKYCSDEEISIDDEKGSEGINSSLIIISLMFEIDKHSTFNDLKRKQK
jgi:hypothetical protein